ncbi:MAG: 2-oxoglutarate dehydrogenase complex dihydrolipoyllysine-residue succinyltransferase [Desulfobacterales bacterium]
MAIEIRVPSVGESVTEALLAQWLKRDGDLVRKDEVLLVLETDKVTLEVTAQATGRLSIRVPQGSTVKIGQVVGLLEEAAEAAAAKPDVPRAAAAAEPAEDAGAKEREPAREPREEKAPAAAPPPPPDAAAGLASPAPADLPPSVRRLVAEQGVDVRRIRGTGPGGRVTKGDVLLYLESRPAPAAAPPAETGAPVCPPCAAPLTEERTRKPMSPIRRRIAERLLQARQNTAMLTTFNDIDMSAVLELRRRYKEAFEKKHGVSLGLMSFFVKASVEALKAVPEINAYIDGGDIVYPHYYHIGIAVGAERGLVVPVIRHADRLSFAQIEQAVRGFVERIRENRLTLAELEGGTFTITNGGVFGSLLSTPILNTPQSGILGMHRIDKRPVVVGDEIVIRPMMYVALSYDHRIVDGREAVTFLKHIKECIEDPERILMEI